MDNGLNIRPLDEESSQQRQAAIPQDLVEQYLNSKMTDNALQRVEGNMSNRAGLSPGSAKTGLTEVAQAEIDAYLSERKNKNKPKKGKSYKSTDMVDSSGRALSYDPEKAKYLYMEGEGEEAKPKYVDKPMKRIKKGKGDGTGKPKGKPLSDKALEFISSTDSLMGDVSEIEKIAGVDTGFYTSLANDFSLKYAGGAGVDDGYRDLKIRTAGVLNRMMKKISGAAVSDQEKDRLMAQLANMADQPRDFKEKLQVFKSDLARARKDFIDTQRKGNRDVSAFEVPDGNEEPSAPQAPQAPRAPKETKSWMK